MLAMDRRRVVDQGHDGDGWCRRWLWACLSVFSRTKNHHHRHCMPSYTVFMHILATHVSMLHSLRRTTATMSSSRSTWLLQACSHWSTTGTSRLCCCMTPPRRTSSSTSRQTARAQSCAASQRQPTPSCRQRSSCRLSSRSRAGQGRCVGGLPPLHPSHGAVAVVQCVRVAAAGIVHSTATAMCIDTGPTAWMGACQ